MTHRPSEAAWDRRRVLFGIGAGTAALAGCLNGGGDDSGANGEDGDPNETTDAVPDDYDPGLVLDGIALDSAFPIRLADPQTDDTLSDIHYHSPEQMHWHRMPLTIPRAESTQIEVVVQDHQTDRIPLGPDGELTVEMEPIPSTANDLIDIEIDGAMLDLYGTRQGTGTYEVGLRQNEDTVWAAPDLTIEVS